LFFRHPAPRDTSGSRDLSSCAAAKIIGHFCRKYEKKGFAFAALEVYIRPPVLTESFNTISIASSSSPSD